MFERLFLTKENKDAKYIEFRTLLNENGPFHHCLEIGVSQENELSIDMSKGELLDFQKLINEYIKGLAL